MSDDQKTLGDPHANGSKPETEPEKKAESSNETPPTEAKAAIRSAFFGIDEEGYFILHVHAGKGPLHIIGFLQRAIIKMNQKIDDSEEQARKKQQELVKPKGLGRFNLFK